METGTAGSTFVAGGVDAAETWQPWLGKVTQLPNAKVLTSSADKPGRIIDVLYMNRTVIDQRRDDVVKLIRAMGKATDWYLNGHKSEGDAIMASFWKLSPQEEAETVSGMKFVTLEANQKMFGTAAAPGPLYDTTKSAAELWLDSKVISKPIDAKALVAFDPVHAAAAH
jgi:NitT/TauT family transport system substrate-binding protein